MDYEKIYNSLMEKARHRNRKSNTYYEKHHILPKSLGGDNSESNLVYLTAREHLIAHKLLVKFKVGADKTKMQTAYFFMFYSKNPKRKYSTRDLAFARQQCSEAKLGSSTTKGMKLNISEDRRNELRVHGLHVVSSIDNSGKVAAIDTHTGSYVQVSSDIFNSSDRYVGVNSGRTFTSKVHNTAWMYELTQEERDEKFGNNGASNGASSEKSLNRYGTMSESEFQTWCLGKSTMGVKRASTFRERYKQLDKVACG